jgi:type I restriction enzyme M protein
MDAIVSNYPYSIKWIGEDDPTLINDPRFAPAGVLAPKSKADLAFLMHITSWLASDGTAAVVSFPGVLYRGASEAKIRKYLVDSNFIDAIIQLPDNLFFGTSIATCVIVIKKNKKEAKTLFIDASKQFIHEGNKNKLSDANIQTILDEWVNREEVKHFSALVDNNIIAANGYNLSVSTYVEQEDTREKVDIVKLNAELKEIVEKENRLRAEIDKIIAELQ